MSVLTGNRNERLLFATFVILSINFEKCVRGTTIVNVRRIRFVNSVRKKNCVTPLNR